MDAPGGDHSKCIKSDRSRHKSYGIIRVEFINQIGINELIDKKKNRLTDLENKAFFFFFFLSERTLWDGGRNSLEGLD